MNMRSIPNVQASIANDGIGSRAPCMPIGALFVALWMLPIAARAQTPAAAPPGDCRAANIQLADDLLQALTAARSKRSSFTMALKLVPIEVQLKSLKAAQQADAGTAADCQRIASQINVEHGRLARLIPELQVAPSAPSAPSAPPAPAAAAAAAVAPTAGPAPGSPNLGACAADNEQTRADLAQRFVLFMQLAQVPTGGLAPYQNFGRRLSSLDANMAARPDDCNAHRAVLAQANIELQQLMAMEARTASSQGPGAAGGGDRQPDGAMPLLSGPSTEACVAELRSGFRETQQAATGLLMTQPEGPGRVQAQRLLDRVVQQQVDSFSRSPMSAEACDQSRRNLGELRASISATRDGATQTAARQPPPSQSASLQSAPRQVAPPAPQAQAQAAPSQPREENHLRDCMDHNRRLYADLEREGKSLKGSGRLNPGQSADLDRQLGDYREWMRKTFSPVQCGVLADNMKSYLALMRQGARSPVAPPAPAVPVTTAAPAALPAKPVPSVQPPPARPAAHVAPPVAPPAAPPVAQRAPVPAAAAPVRPPAAPPTKVQRANEAER